MFIIRPLFACAALIIGTGFTTLANADFITNGDFSISVPRNSVGGGWESSTIDAAGGWFSTGGNPDGHFVLNSGAAPLPEPTIKQTVSGLTAGQTYLLSWDYKVHFLASGSVPDSFGVFVDDPTLAANHIFVGGDVSGNWISESELFTATSTSHTFFFIGELSDPAKGSSSNSDVSYRLDNVSLVSAIPEPGAGLLLGLIGVVVCVQRRKIVSGKALAAGTSH